MDAKRLLRRYGAGERNFQGVKLEAVELRGVDLGRIQLNGASLRKAKLR
ncbi:MAG TPA: pentapeptide repeat-containing protein, partial [Anaerolineae bacterium]|nr:pentapeptide repeat-containing protein [Anaerolineae bacterium]